MIVMSTSLALLLLLLNCAKRLLNTTYFYLHQSTVRVGGREISFCRGGVEKMGLEFNFKEEEGAGESTILVVTCLVCKRGEVKVGM